MRLPLIIVLSFLALNAQAQNPYMLSEPFSRRAEKWDHRHNVPFNYNLAYNRAKEAGRNLTFLLRDELDAGIILTSGTYSYRYYVLENLAFPGTAADTSFTINVRPKSAFHIW
jgi:hypothetical protein